MRGLASLLSYDQCPAGQRSIVTFLNPARVCSLPWDLQSALSISVSWPVTGSSLMRKVKISGRGTSASEKAFGVLHSPAAAPLSSPACVPPTQPSSSLCSLPGQGKLPPAGPSSHLLLPFICRPGLAVPGPQRKLPGELPAAVPGEPGSPAQEYYVRVSVRTGSHAWSSLRAPEPRPNIVPMHTTLCPPLRALSLARRPEDLHTSDGLRKPVDLPVMALARTRFQLGSTSRWCLISLCLASARPQILTEHSAFAERCCRKCSERLLRAATGPISEDMGSKCLWLRARQECWKGGGQRPHQAWGWREEVTRQTSTQLACWGGRAMLETRPRATMNDPVSCPAECPGL